MATQSFGAKDNYYTKLLMIQKQTYKHKNNPSHAGSWSCQLEAISSAS